MASRKFDVSILIGAIDNASKQLESNSDLLGVLGASAKIAAAGIALTSAAIGVMVWRASELETQMANVNTMLDEQTEQFLPQLTAGILNMAETYGQSTETLSAGLYNVLSASIDVADSMAVLETSVIAASAGMTDTGTSAKAIVTILNSYQLQAGKAADISDLLFSVVKRGQTTFAELSSSIGVVASTASVSGLSMEQMGAALSTMTRAGIDTTMAVTSLNSILKAFVKPTKEAQIAASKLDIELSSNTLRTQGLIPVLEKLSTATTEQQAAIFGNVRAFKGLAAILQQEEGFLEDVAIMTDRTGRTQEAFAKQSDTLAFKLKRLGQAVLVRLAREGDKFIPIIKKMADTILNDLLPQLDFWIEQSGVIEGAIALVSEVIEGSVEAIDEMTLSIEMLIVMMEWLDEQTTITEETNATAWENIGTVLQTQFMASVKLIIGLQKTTTTFTKTVEAEAMKRVAVDKAEMAAKTAEQAAFLKIDKVNKEQQAKNEDDLAERGRKRNEAILKNEMDTRNQRISLFTTMYNTQIAIQEKYKKDFEAMQSDLISGSKAAFTKLFNNIGEGWSSLSDFMKDIGNVLKNALISQIAQVAAEWITRHALMTAATWGWALAEKAATLVVFLANLAVAAIKTIAGWASIPFVGWALGIAAAAALVSAANSQFKFFAKGTENFGGGMAVVGEEGPELMRLPGGTSIVSNKKSQGLLAGAGGQTLTFNFFGNEIMGDEAMDNFADKISETILETIQLETNVL